MYYILEGLPGAGKTSLCKALSAVLDKATLEIVPEFLPEIKADRHDVSYYIENEHRKSILISKGSKNLGVCDRYWHSTAIYSTACCNGTTLSDFLAVKRILYKRPLFSKYIYVYLRVPPTISRSRAQVPDVPNLWLSPRFCERAFGLYDLVFNQLDRIDPGVLGKFVYNVSTLRLDRVVSQILCQMDLARIGPNARRRGRTR